MANRENLQSGSPDNYNWAPLGPLGVVDIYIETDGSPWFVTSAQMMRTIQGLDTGDAMAIHQAFRGLAEHHTDHHRYPKSELGACLCDLDVWTDYKQPALVPPEDVLQIAEILESDITAFLKRGITLLRARNIIDTAQILRTIAEGAGVEI